jgi:hypothetical protein
MNRTRTGLVILALLALLDVVGVVGVFVDNGPPWFIALPSALLGLVTLGALVPAWRGGRGAMMTVLASRVISALTGVTVFFAPEAPTWAVIGTVAFITLTLVGAVLVAGSVRAVGTGSPAPTTAGRLR